MKSVKKFQTPSKTKMIIFLVMIGLAGCARDDLTLSPLHGNHDKEARTPDEVIVKLGAAYENCDYAAYEALLTDDFVFSMKPCSVNELGKGSPDVMWGKADELTIAGRMFSHKACTNSAGVVVPGMKSITVEQCEQLIPWEDAHEDDQPGVLRSVYDMRVRFELEDGRVMLVDGPTSFYVAEALGSAGDVIYKLRGWVDE